MHYWNQENFEGLASIGAACASEGDLELFAQYCQMREKGLRKQAIEAASSFAMHLNGLDVGVQREISMRLVELQHVNPGIHQLLPHPIRMELIGILQAWTDGAPEEVLPRVSLGLLSGDIEHFEAALRLQPNEQTSLARLAQFHMNNVDFKAHHLSESSFIGTIDEAHESLRQAAALIERLTSPLQDTALTNELTHHKFLISEWSIYCTEKRTESFPQWSLGRGHTFGFPNVVYYSE
jgi:hypothetical protein